MDDVQSAKRTNRFSMSPMNIALSVCCVLGLAIFSVRAVNPSLQEASDVRRALEKAQSAVKRQQILYPLYAELTVANEKAATASVLPRPKKEPLAPEHIVEIPERLNKKAMAARLQLTDVSPRVVTLSDGRQYIAVNMRAKGAFAAFRSFLLSLGELPSFEHVERLTVRKGIMCEELELTAWLAIE